MIGPKTVKQIPHRHAAYSYSASLLMLSSGMYRDDMVPSEEKNTEIPKTNEIVSCIVYDILIIPSFKCTELFSSRFSYKLYFVYVILFL